jgi:hypothetical protein
MEEKRSGTARRAREEREPNVCACARIFVGGVLCALSPSLSLSLYFTLFLSLSLTRSLSLSLCCVGADGHRGGYRRRDAHPCHRARRGASRMRGLG